MDFLVYLEKLNNFALSLFRDVIDTMKFREADIRAVQSNEDIVRHFIDIDSLDALAFYYLVKRRFLNSTIYNYSPAVVAKEFNLSPYLVQKYIRTLRKEGLIIKHKKNLTLAGRNTMVNKFKLDVYYTDYGLVKIRPHKCTLFIKETHSLKDIKLQLLSKLLQQKIAQQEYVRHQKADCKKTSRRSKREYRNETLFDENILSYRAIAKIFKMALSTCYKTVREMVDKEFIKIKTIKFVLEVSTPDAFSAGEDVLQKYFGYTFFNKYDRCIWAVPGSAIQFPYFHKQMNIPLSPIKEIRFSYGVTESLFT